MTTRLEIRQDEVRGVKNRLIVLSGNVLPDELFMQLSSAARGEPTEVGQISLDRETAADLRDALSLWLTERDDA